VTAAASTCLAAAGFAVATGSFETPLRMQQNSHLRHPRPIRVRFTNLSQTCEPHVDVGQATHPLLIRINAEFRGIWRTGTIRHL
jgi:hypothetical protein